MSFRKNGLDFSCVWNTVGYLIPLCFQWSRSGEINQMWGDWVSVTEQVTWQKLQQLFALQCNEFPLGWKMYQLAASGIIHQILARKKNWGFYYHFRSVKFLILGWIHPEEDNKKKPLHEMNETGKKKKWNQLSTLAFNHLWIKQMFTKDVPKCTLYSILFTVSY